MRLLHKVGGRAEQRQSFCRAPYTGTCVSMVWVTAAEL